MAEMGVSGVASGIDWDSMITKLIENAKKPALVQVAKKEKLQAKADYYDEFLVALRGLQSTLSPLKLTSTFKAKEVTVDRLDSNASAKGVLNATVSSDAEVNVHSLEVLQIAKAQINRSLTFTGEIGTINNANDSYFYVNTGGLQIKVEFTKTDTLQTLSDKINTALQSNVPPVAVTASVIDNKLILKSNNTGRGSTTINTVMKRAASGNDTLTFYTIPGNTNSATYTINAELAGGSFKITKDNNTYVEGRDFDIVNGNEIQWRNSGYNSVPIGGTSQITYKPASGEIYYTDATRAAAGSTDKGVLSMNVAAGTTLDPANLKITNSSGSVTFDEGIDYTVQGQDIVWLDGGRKPGAGVGYKIEYAPAGTEEFTFDVQRNDTDLIGTAFSSFASAGSATITAPGGVTYNQGTDFDIVDIGGNAAIRWKAYNAPTAGASYTIAGTGVPTPPPTTTRAAEDSIDLSEYFGSTWAWDPNKITKVEYGGKPLTPNPATPPGTTTGDYTLTATGLKWNPTLATPIGSSAPSGDYTVEYTYDTSTFELTDGGSGALEKLGLFSDVTAAQDAIMILNGETVTRSSNKISEADNNELIKGMTLELRGVGSVSLSVEQDANVAVEAINAFLTSYNDIMSWVNTRLTEKELDEDKKATIDSDDFRYNWGVLNGSSILRNAKTMLRRLTSQLYTAERSVYTSRNSVFAPLKEEGTISFTVYAKGSDGSQVEGRTISIDVRNGGADTMQKIADIINGNHPTAGAGLMPDGTKNPFLYDDQGNSYMSPVGRATLENGKLSVSANYVPNIPVDTNPDDGTTTYTSYVLMEGSSYVLDEMQLKPEYNALSQVGLKLPSSGDGGITEEALMGQLEFDTNIFMETLGNNADDVAGLFTTFAANMQTYMDNMVKTSQKEVAGVTMVQGTVAREVDNINNQINTINKYLADFERRLQDKETALVAQFSAAEVSLSKLMQQASWLDSVSSQLKSGNFG